VVVEETDLIKRKKGFSTWLGRSSKVQIWEGKLLLGPLEINVSEAQCWDPKPDWEEIYRQRELVLQNYPKLIFPFLRDAPSESLMQIMKGSSNLEFGFLGHQEAMPNTSDRFVKAALEPIRCMIQGIREDQQSLWEQGVRSLAGLGQGLTPAGDDFILGAIYALRVVFPHEQAERIAQSICELATHRTSYLSAAYLKAACKGEAVELWHQLLDALTCCDENVNNGILQFRDVGHTSGFDALAGFVCILSHF
jgi:hypothetical protein